MRMKLPPGVMIKADVPDEPVVEGVTELAPPLVTRFTKVDPCYLYDPAIRRSILREAARKGTMAHKSGYGPRFETALLMLKEGLLKYGELNALVITGAGHETLKLLDEESELT